MTVVAVALATLAAVIGLYGSFYLNVASGPAIVLVETGFFLAALGARTADRARRPPGHAAGLRGRRGRLSPSDLARYCW